MKQYIYHNICRIEFNNRRKSSTKNPVCTAWHIHRDNHQTIFLEVSALVEDNVVNRGHCYFLTYLHKLCIY